MARDLNQRIAGSELVVLPAARHFSPVEQPEVFNRTVLDFLSRVGYK
jgi:pimeloyl-ACP methyl ester carboxylesterase